jgi:hypothetical protein
MTEIATPPRNLPDAKCLPSADEIAEAKQTRVDVPADWPPKSKTGRKPLFGR